MSNSIERPQADDVRHPPPEGVKKTWGGPAFPCEHEAEQLSALADGELDPKEVARACANWRAGTSSHATWHAYHLIGDVLRSDDLASIPRIDHASLERLRERLAGEPVVLAPEPTVRRAAVDRTQRMPWAALSAVAAGFAAVAAVLIVLGGPSADSQSRTGQIVLSEAATAANVAIAGSRPFEQGPQPLLADGKLVRDAGLDRYLDAHKHFSGVSALGVPSTFLRGATSDASNR